MDRQEALANNSRSLSLPLSGSPPANPHSLAALFRSTALRGCGLPRTIHSLAVLVRFTDTLYTNQEQVLFQLAGDRLHPNTPLSMANQRFPTGRLLYHILHQSCSNECKWINFVYLAIELVWGRR